MIDSLILNKKSIESIYKTICEYHEKYLAQFGVKLPKLYASKKKFTKDALVLVYLSYDYPNTRKVSKEELTKFVRSYYPKHKRRSASQTFRRVSWLVDSCRRTR